MKKIIALILLVPLLMLGVGPAKAKGGFPTTTEVAVWDAAASETTAWARTVEAIKVYQGDVYAGYGDWSANTGPVTIQKYDPSTGVVSDDYEYRTEAVHLFRTIDGDLYAPSYDRKGCCDYAYKSGYWIPVDFGTGQRSAHLFDITGFNGNLYASGQQGNIATIWKSTDGGATWAIDFQDTNHIRFHWISNISGTLYTSAGQGAPGWSTTGSGWTQESNLTLGGTVFKPMKLNGKIITMGWYPLPPQYGVSGWLSVWDGTSTTAVKATRKAMGIHDIAVDGGWLYVLLADGWIKRTDDLNNWKRVAKVDGSSRKNGTIGRSLDVAGNTVYVGTTESTLHAATFNG